jgi:hypothetical protein
MFTDACDLTNTSPTTVRITDAFIDNMLIFSIGIALNPDSTRPSGSFSVYIYSSTNSVISQTSGVLSYSS